MTIDYCHFKDLELKTAQKQDTWFRNAYKNAKLRSKFVISEHRLDHA